MKAFSISEWIVKGFFACMGAMLFMFVINFVASIVLLHLLMKGVL